MQEDFHHRYYRAKEGRWAGRFVLQITEPLKLGELAFFDQLSVRMLAFVSSRLPVFRFSTSVDYSSRGAQNQVRHTTRLSYLGWTLFYSTEEIDLKADGQSFVMTSRQRFFPFWGKVTSWSANGAVETDFDGAYYEIPWLGTQMEQRTRMTDKGLEVVQQTSFSRAVILLQPI